MFKFGEYNKDFSEYKITRPIRLIELFGGLGTQAMALRDIGVNFEHYRLCEFDKFAVNSYNAIHNTKFIPTDIRNLKGDDLGIKETDKYEYIMTYSFPCFPGETLVLTDRGYVELKDVLEGDKVLTHDNTYREVTTSAKTGNKRLYTLSCGVLEDLKCTGNHKFYVRKETSEPIWMECEKLTKDYYVGFAINQNSTIPEDYIVYRNTSFWWLLGKELHKGLKDTLEVREHITKSGLQYRMVGKKIEITSEVFKNLMALLKEEKVPSFMFDLPTEHLQNFFDGIGDTFIEGDSKEYVYSLAQLFVKATTMPYTISNICFKWVLSLYKMSDAFYEDNILWTRITKVNSLKEKQDVYDLTVEGNHSFTANGVIVHNCTDLSSAGTQSGMAKGSGTRSSLLWEVERLLNEVNELPQVLVMENVVNVHDDKNIVHFQAWLDFLKDKGYSNYYKDLNGSDFGVPHNRKRCFVVSILGNYNYIFPNSTNSSLVLKDILDETSASSEDYTSNENVDNFLKTLIGKKPKSNILGFIDKGTGKHQSNMVYNTNTVCPCLCASDYKSPKKIIVCKTEDPYNLLLNAKTFDDIKDKIKVRRLTTKEYWRLMGYTDTDFDKVKNITSATQIYKQCGNAIVKNCLSAIFKQLNIQS